MNAQDRKKTAVITKYAVESFSQSDWYALGQLTGKLEKITGNSRLLRSLEFGDPDYEQSAAEVLAGIFSEDSGLISDVVEHFDIDLWYRQKSPERSRRIFDHDAIPQADFWTDGYLRLFISHRSSGKGQVSVMRTLLAGWGISAFVAKEDIQPTKKWRLEVEAGLETMEVMLPVVEPGFKESDWCTQEVGYALGRKIEIIPLCIGAMDPFGLFGEIQGIKGSGKTPSVVADEIAALLLKKPKHRTALLQSMAKAFASLQSDPKIKKIQLVDSWLVASDEQLKVLVEASSLSEYEKRALKNTIARVGAFKPPAPIVDPWSEDVPF